MDEAVEDPCRVEHLVYALCGVGELLLGRSIPQDHRHGLAVKRADDLFQTVQVEAVRILRRLSQQGIRWAYEALDGLYLDPEIETVVRRAAAIRQAVALKEGDRSIAQKILKAYQRGEANGGTYQRILYILQY